MFKTLQEHMARNEGPDVTTGVCGNDAIGSVNGEEEEGEASHEEETEENIASENKEVIIDGDAAADTQDVVLGAEGPSPSHAVAEPTEPCEPEEQDSQEPQKEGLDSGEKAGLRDGKLPLQLEPDAWTYYCDGCGYDAEDKGTL